VCVCMCAYVGVRVLVYAWLLYDSTFLAHSSQYQCVCICMHVFVCVYLCMRVFYTILLSSLMQVNAGECVYVCVCLCVCVFVYVCLLYDSPFIAQPSQYWCVSFDFNVSYSSCWGYSLINTFKLKKKIDFGRILLSSLYEVNTVVIVDVCACVNLCIDIFCVNLLSSLIEVNTGVCIDFCVCMRVYMSCVWFCYPRSFKSILVRVFMCVCVCVCMCACVCIICVWCYGVATISRLLKIIGLFCKRAL
jgi:hypothetical protein